MTSTAPFDLINWNLYLNRLLLAVLGVCISGVCSSIELETVRIPVSTNPTSLS